MKHKQNHSMKEEANAKKMSEIFASLQHLMLGGPWKNVGLEKEGLMKNKRKGDK